MKIGLLHPGDMGASIGHSLRLSGNEVYWASERPLHTCNRADRAGLNDLISLNDLSKEVEMLVSVCPAGQ
jgi:3-hydroxyisobutyrate dehydrogenase-like beta-hydroxyacid dehydrogenase